MDFESILEKWENRRDPGGNAPKPLSGSSEKRPTGDNGAWLEAYPPGGEVASEKERDNRPPISEGRSIWHKRPVQDTLDLHGLTGQEARKEITGFIRSMRRRGFRKGLIIHGKGLHSPEGSVLKPLVREVLESSPEVGEFGRGGKKDGGSGATWFLLRQRSR